MAKNPNNPDNKNKESKAGNSLSELVTTLDGLKSEIQDVTSKARHHIELSWSSQADGFKNEFESWLKNAKITQFCTFTVTPGSLHTHHTLSHAAFQHLPETLVLDEGLSKCDSKFAESWSNLLPWALGTRELQIDFATGFGICPLVFFDNVVGVILFARPAMKPAEYGELASHCAKLLAQIRQSVLKEGALRLHMFPAAS